jgi:hypothetical protein
MTYTDLHRTTALRNAVSLAIDHGNSISDVKIEHWEKTYNTPGQVARIWEEELTRKSLQARNSYEVEGK